MSLFIFLMFVISPLHLVVRYCTIAVFYLDFLSSLKDIVIGFKALAHQQNEDGCTKNDVMLSSASQPMAIQLLNESCTVIIWKVCISNKLCW